MILCKTLLADNMVNNVSVILKFAFGLNQWFKQRIANKSQFIYDHIKGIQIHNIVQAKLD